MDNSIFNSGQGGGSYLVGLSMGSVDDTVSITNTVGHMVNAGLSGYNSLLGSRNQPFVLTNLITNVPEADMIPSAGGVYLKEGVYTTDVDFTGAFNDTSDLRINKAWADVNLVGKGFAGSNIIEGFYFEDTGTGPGSGYKVYWTMNFSGVI